jgi:hypothetical protein
VNNDPQKPILLGVLNPLAQVLASPLANHTHGRKDLGSPETGASKEKEKITRPIKRARHQKY